MASRGSFLLVAIDPDDPGGLQVVDEAPALARDLGVGVRLLTALSREGSRSSKMLGFGDDGQAMEGERAALAKLERHVEVFDRDRVPVRCVVGVGR